MLAEYRTAGAEGGGVGGIATTFGMCECVFSGSVPTLTKEVLLARERYVFVFCARRFRLDELAMREYFYLAADIGTAQT
jgi:hypothetical protein